MASYEMMGRVSKNKYQKNDTQPAITGISTINGVEYRIAGWPKKDKEGPFYSLKFTIKDEASKPASSTSMDDIDDEIPF